MKPSLLHHLGLPSSQVPAAAVLLEADIARHLALPLVADTASERREFRSGRLKAVPEVVVCAGFFGSPAAVIAMEELVRAGVRAAVAVTVCRCHDCAVNGPASHNVVVAFAAVRDEFTSDAYAPQGFPALPDPALTRILRSLLPSATAEIVRTVDVPSTWRPASSAADSAGPVDLHASALMVVAAARAAAVGVVALGAAALQGDSAERVGQIIERAASAAEQRSRHP